MPGLFIALEGSDGSGKTTQLKLLAARLEAVGYGVDQYDFPRYKEPSSYFVQQYLSGKYGPASEVSPYTASLFYAVDRYEAAGAIRQSLADNKIVIANRYTGSNMAHQGSKFGSQAEKRGFFIWAENLEYELLGVPRPELSFYLHMPTDISTKLIRHRSKHSKVQLDEHERDHNHLDSTNQTYELLCQLFPKDFIKIDCAKADKPLSIKQISDLLWATLKPLLPFQPPHEAKTVTVNLAGKPKAAKKPIASDKKSSKKRRK